MPIATYFVQECPTCGRRLQIRVEHLGKPVACQHCQGTFVAADSSSVRGETVDDQGSALLRQANELLDSVGTAAGAAARRQAASDDPLRRFQPDSNSSSLAQARQVA